MSRHKNDTPPAVTHVVVDGIEGKVARVELPDGTTEDWSLANLPDGVKEGDVIAIHEQDGDFSMEVSHEETKSRRDAAQRQLEALNQDAPKGEINL